MSFFDSVKEDVREEHRPDEAGTDAEEGDDDVPFDQLKKDAEEQDDEEQNVEADDDDIEVLRSDDTDTADASAGTGPDTAGEQQAGQAQSDATAAEPGAQDATSSAAGETAGDGADTEPVARDEVVQALKRIEEQNDAMLDVLRGIKRSLDS